ncbi:MAG: NUDIX domain-containing protein [Lachnospiraceae bacterium]|nr:NUDIX domain-containing protein [Lachnospiraceae bacterium]
MSDYIMDLRKIVAHRPLLQVGASVIVEDEKGRILLQKRSDNHCWGYAGGSVELDETAEDEVSNIDIVYICRNYTGTLRKQENEVEELKFFALNEIPKKISPPIQKPLNQWIELQKRSSNKIISNDLTGGSKWE